MSVRTPLPLIDYTVTYANVVVDGESWPVAECPRCNKIISAMAYRYGGRHAGVVADVRDHMEAEHGPAARRRAR